MAYQILLYQITVDGGNLAKVDLRDYLDSSSVDPIYEIEPDVVDISEITETLEIEAGVYEVGDVGVTVDGLRPEFFREAGDKNKPFVLEVRKDGTTIFHGVVNRETVLYNARTDRTAFSVQTWEYILSEFNVPSRTVYEAEVGLFRSFDLQSNIIEQILIPWDAEEETFFNAIINDPEYSYVIEYDRVVRPDEIMTVRGYILAHSGQVQVGDDLFLALTISPFGSEVEITRNNIDLQYTLGLVNIPEQERAYFSILDDTTDYAWLQAAAQDYRLRFRIRRGDGSIFADWRGVQLPIQSQPIPGIWVTPPPRPSGYTLFDPIVISGGTVDYNLFTADIRGELIGAVRPGSPVRIFGKDFYGHVPPEQLTVDADKIVEAIFSLSEFEPLYAVLDDLSFVGQIDGLISKLVVPDDDPLEVIRMLQNTTNTFMRITPKRDGNDMPRIDVQFISRNQSTPEGDVAQTGPEAVVEWQENPVEIPFDGVIVVPHEEINMPPDYGQVVGVYFDGIEDLTPEDLETLGLPQNAIEVTVFDTPSYTPYITDPSEGHPIGVILRGEGRPIVVDAKLTERAKIIHNFYRQFYRTFAAEYAGEFPNIVGTYATTDESTIQESGLVTSSSLRLDISDPRTKVEGRIGAFLPAPPPPLPVPRINGPDLVLGPDGDTVTAVYTSTGSLVQGVATYLWELDSGSGFVSIGTSPSVEAEFLIDPEQEYTLRLTITNPTGPASVTKTIGTAIVVPPTLPRGPVVYHAVVFTETQRQVRIYVQNEFWQDNVTAVKYYESNTPLAPDDGDPFTQTATFVFAGGRSYWRIIAGGTEDVTRYVNFRIDFQDADSFIGQAVIPVRQSFEADIELPAAPVVHSRTVGSDLLLDFYNMTPDLGDIEWVGTRHSSTPFASLSTTKTDYTAATYSAGIDGWEAVIPFTQKMVYVQYFVEWSHTSSPYVAEAIYYAGTTFLIESDVEEFITEDDADQIYRRQDVQITKPDLTQAFQDEIDDKLDQADIDGLLDEDAADLLYRRQSVQIVKADFDTALTNELDSKLEEADVADFITETDGDNRYRRQSIAIAKADLTSALQTEIDDKLVASDVADFITETDGDNRYRRQSIAIVKADLAAALQTEIDDKLVAADVADFITETDGDSRYRRQTVAIVKADFDTALTTELDAKLEATDVGDLAFEDTVGLATAFVTGQLPGPKLADGAVTTVKIGNSQVTNAKIGTNQITKNRLATAFQAEIDDKLVAADVADFITETEGDARYRQQTVDIVRADLATAVIEELDAKLEETDVGDLAFENTVGLASLFVTGQLPEAKLADGAVTQSKIGTNAVVAAKINASAVTEAKINNGAVTVNKIGAGAVTDVKIAAGAVTDVKIATGAVTEDKIGAGAVTEDKIGAFAVDTGKIVNNAITGDKLATNSVANTKILDGAVISSKIFNGAVTEAKLATDSVTPTKIRDGAVESAKIADNAVTTAKIGNDQVTDLKLSAPIRTAIEAAVLIESDGTDDRVIGYSDPIDAIYFGENGRLMLTNVASGHDIGMFENEFFIRVGGSPQMWIRNTGVQFNGRPTALATQSGDPDTTLATKKYVDDAAAGGGGAGFGLAGENYLSLNTSTEPWELTANPVNLGSSHTTGTVPTAKIANAAVTYAKIQNVPTQTVLGRSSGGGGSVTALTSLPNSVQDNIVRTGVLNAGSINTGFGNIHIGSSTINAGSLDTQGAITAGGNISTVETVSGGEGVFNSISAGSPFASQIVTAGRVLQNVTINIGTNAITAGSLNASGHVMAEGGFRVGSHGSLWGHSEYIEFEDINGNYHELEFAGGILISYIRT